MTLDLDMRTAEIVGEALMKSMSETGREVAYERTLEGMTLRQAIGIYTAQKVAETVNYAKANSRFYAEKLVGFDGIGSEHVATGKAKIEGNGSTEKSGWTDIPFTTPSELAEREMDFLCVSPSEISRIVTMQTSGTTGKPKRIYFTEEDQQLTVDYFNHGMRLIIDETDKVLILMPSSSDGSIGRLLGKGIRDMGAKAIEYGEPFKTSDDGAGTDENVVGENAAEAAEILQLMRDEKVTSVVATPTHMVALARALKKELDAAESSDGAGVCGGNASGNGIASDNKEIYLRSILLSAEFVPDKTVMMLEDVFQCMIFEHYGMTEMGLGCAVSCGYGRGYHVREADLFIELINPITGEVVKGESPRTPGFSNYGEIVFTTLTRKGMPFIRYRTGDFSRWILDECPCGSQLKRLDKVVPGEDRA